MPANYHQGELFDSFVEAYYELSIEHGIFIARYKNNVVVDKAISLEINVKRELMCADKKYPCLIFAEDVKYWTKEARALMATDHYNRFSKAIAVISNTSLVHATLINFYLKFDRPKIPTRFFINSSNATEWLKKYY